MARFLTRLRKASAKGSGRGVEFEEQHTKGLQTLQ